MVYCILTQFVYSVCTVLVTSLSEPQQNRSIIKITNYTLMGVGGGRRLAPSEDFKAKCSQLNILLSPYFPLLNLLYTELFEIGKICSSNLKLLKKKTRKAAQNVCIKGTFSTHNLSQF